MVGVGIYVLDEPSANLDSEGTEQLRQVLKSLKEQGNTIIISEHKPSDPAPQDGERKNRCRAGSFVRPKWIFKDCGGFEYIKAAVPYALDKGVTPIR